jgi:hypothetical protein
MVHPDGMKAMKGVHSLGCAYCGEYSWWIGIVVGVKLGFGVGECGESTTRKDRSPFGLIASAQGWPTIERK